MKFIQKIFQQNPKVFSREKLLSCENASAHFASHISHIFGSLLFHIYER